MLRIRKFQKIATLIVQNNILKLTRFCNCCSSNQHTLKRHLVPKHLQINLAETLVPYFPHSAGMHNILRLQSAFECYTANSSSSKLEPSVFVKIITTWPTMYVMHCSIQEFRNILEESSALDWSKMMYFIDLSPEQVSVLTSIVEQRKGKVWANKLISFKWKEKDFPVISDTTLKIPEGLKLIRVGPEYADLILRHWPYQIQTTRTDLARILALFGGVAFAEIDSGRLVSWTALNDIGRYGYSHTIEEYRNKGLCQNLIHHFHFLTSKAKIFPCSHTLPSNNTSVRVSLRGGFVQEGIIFEAYYSPPQMNEEEARKFKMLKEAY